jgi:hypothetical protein
MVKLPTVLLHFIGSLIGFGAEVDAVARRKLLPLPGTNPSRPVRKLDTVFTEMLSAKCLPLVEPSIIYG